MKLKRIGNWTGTLLAVAALWLPAGLRGGDFVYLFGDTFSGSSPSAEPPWFSAGFESVGQDRVRLTVTTLNLSGAENINELYFNFNPALDPTELTVDLFPGSGGFLLPRIATGENRFKAGGDGRYDLKLQFAKGGGVETRFTAGDHFVCEFYGVPGLAPTDFAFLSTPVGSAGLPLYAAAHVQRIGAESSSGWLFAGAPVPVPVPEPGPLALWIVAGAIWLVFGWPRQGWSLTPARARQKAEEWRRRA
ncbi:MAG TPA: hypothetical protein PKX23_14070 [Verrucomicrobiota bacterium]|nr:hypothetical protein [Verrucomicrobiota bacterium]HRT09273.1 hypothetical protein [Candidatus Paceibacterota bacterium]HRT56471.1 hypothetical protein [Candidatus Paceibacterota bacterium]